LPSSFGDINIFLQSLTSEEFAMHIVQISFDRSNLQLAAFDDAERAKPFVEIAGLRWKIWLHSEDYPKFGGVYCFENRAAAEAYLAGPIVSALRANPDIANFSAEIFAVAENPSRVTQAPVFFPARAAAE
jgi:Putative mono-oxygenase ydhR